MSPAGNALAFTVTSTLERENARRDTPLPAPSLRPHNQLLELVRYPRSGHGIREPWPAVDRLARIRSWFEHWLGGAATGA